MSHGHGSNKKGSGVAWSLPRIIPGVIAGVIFSGAGLMPITKQVQQLVALTIGCGLSIMLMVYALSRFPFVGGIVQSMVHSLFPWLTRKNVEMWLGQNALVAIFVAGAIYALFHAQPR